MRRKRQPQDSLELFLDAICNMFGGFLFLMLFVVVSIRATREANERTEQDGPTVSAAEYETLEIELEGLREEWRSLAQRLDESKRVADRLTDPKVAETHVETVGLLNDLRKLDEANVERSREIAEIERRNVEAQEERQRLREGLEAAKKAEQEAREEAEQARRANARSSTPPQLRESYKREVVVALKYGKLYFWHKYDAARVQRRLNDDDFLVVRKESLGTITEPRPERGVDLRSENVERLLDEAFKNSGADAYRDRIAILVSDDSYEEYSTLRDYLKRNRYEIEPVVAKKGTRMFDRGGSGGRGQ